MTYSFPLRSCSRPVPVEEHMGLGEVWLGWVVRDVRDCSLEVIQGSEMMSGRKRDGECKYTLWGRPSLIRGNS